MRHRLLFFLSIFFFICYFPGTARANSSEFTLVKQIIAVCNEELRLRTAGFIEVEVRPNGYAEPKWVMYQKRGGLLLMLSLIHNLTLVNPYDTAPAGTPSILQGFLFGEYRDGYGWVWYGRDHITGLPHTSQKWEENINAIKMGTFPLAIIPPVQGPERTIGIRYLCQIYINDHFLFTP